MQLLAIFIEKDGDTYTGSTPNILGLTVTAKTRAECREAMTEVIERRYDELFERHFGRKTAVVRGNFEEAIECLYRYDKASNHSHQKCYKQAQKEGLCWLHWKVLYSHAVGRNGKLTVCELCGEDDPEVLVPWESPCRFKTENPNWEQILEEKRAARQLLKTEEARERRRKENIAKAKKTLKEEQEKAAAQLNRKNRK